MHIPGRAVTPEQKRALIERLYAAWLLCPEQRLGQLLENAQTGLYYIEDDDLADAVEKFVC